MTDQPRIECLLIGAPGSGKSDLAEQFQTMTKDWIQEKGMKNLVRLDGLAQALAEDAGIALGADGDRFTTAAIYYHGEIRRMRTRQTGCPFIDTSSLITCLAHQQARINILSGGIQTQEKAMEAQLELQTGAHLLNEFPFRANLNYVWYVPLPEQIIVPGRDLQTYPAMVDAIMRDMNQKMGLGIPVLEGTREEQVKQMFGDLDRYYQTPDEAEEQSS